jgi:hypothetical protein
MILSCTGSHGVYNYIYSTGHRSQDVAMCTELAEAEEELVVFLHFIQISWRQSKFSSIYLVEIRKFTGRPIRRSR